MLYIHFIFSDLHFKKFRTTRLCRIDVVATDNRIINVTFYLLNACLEDLPAEYYVFIRDFGVELD